MEELFKNNGKSELVFFNGSEFVSNEITEEKQNMLLTSFSILQKYCDLIIYYNALEDAIAELKDYLSTRSIGDGDYTSYSEAHRFTLNMVSMFYSLISFCEKNFDSFKPIIAPHCFDGFYSYRLFYNLRVYMTHKGLSVTSFETTFTPEGGFVTKAIVKAKALIDYEKGNKTFREELKNSGVENIAINDYIDEFILSINSLLYEIFGTYTSEILQAFQSIKSTMKNDCLNNKDTFLKETNGNAHGLLKSLNNFIISFSNELIYKNKIHENPSISETSFELFRQISSIYFEDEVSTVAIFEKYQ